MIHFIFCFWICFGVEKKKSKYFFTQEEHSVKISDCNLFGISRYSRVFSKLRHCMSHFSKYLFLSKPNFSHLTKCRKAFFIHSKHALGNNQRKKILIVTSENDCILVTLQHINSEASKAFTSEALLTADNTEISIQTSSKNSCSRRFNCSATVHYDWNTTTLLRREFWSPSFQTFLGSSQQ